MTDSTSAPPRPTGSRRLGLFLLAFGSGFAVLTIEIAGTRLIAPVFGLSAVPWTAVIGVILAASHYDERKVETVAQRGTARAVVVPMNPGGRTGVDDYFALVDTWVDGLARAFAGG